MGTPSQAKNRESFGMYWESSWDKGTQVTERSMLENWLVNMGNYRLLKRTMFDLRHQPQQTVDLHPSNDLVRNHAMNYSIILTV